MHQSDRDTKLAVFNNTGLQKYQCKLSLKAGEYTTQ